MGSGVQSCKFTDTGQQSVVRTRKGGNYNLKEKEVNQSVNVPSDVAFLSPDLSTCLTSATKVDEGKMKQIDAGRFERETTVKQFQDGDGNVSDENGITVSEESNNTHLSVAAAQSFSDAAGKGIPGNTSNSEAEAREKSNQDLSYIMLEIEPFLHEISGSASEQGVEQNSNNFSQTPDGHVQNIVNTVDDMNQTTNNVVANSIDNGDTYEDGDDEDDFGEDFEEEGMEVDSAKDNDQDPNIENEQCAQILCQLSKSREITMEETCAVGVGKKLDNITSRKQIKTSKPAVTYPKRHPLKDGVVCFAQVGKGAKLWTQEHPLIRGIYLNKGKRDVKRHLVMMKRQPSAVDAGSYLRNGRVNDRNRIDDCFEYTALGLERRRQFEDNLVRDEYVVNWYMWCPGHGNCLRRCGGYGKCMEGTQSFINLSVL